MKLQLVLLFNFIIFFSSIKLHAAACCGGGFASPSLIAGDDRAQFTSSYGQTQVVVDNVDSSGIWRKSKTQQKIQTIKLEGAHIFADLWQAGFSLPVIQRSHHNETHSGLGDVALTLGYEYLSDWNYNILRPKGIGFLQLILPTGKSKMDSDRGGLDSRGNGFLALGAGTLLTKSWARWDAYTSIDLHRSFSKPVRNLDMNAEALPGYGGNLAVGLGYNLKDLRFGSSVTWTYEDPIILESKNVPLTTRSEGTIERYATTQFSISYMANDEWSGTASYTDQTLMGSPINTSLGRGLILQIQKRWMR